MLPYAPDAWYAPDSVKVGYEISFTPPLLHAAAASGPLEEIRADILALERETEGIAGERSWELEAISGLAAMNQMLTHQDIQGVIRLPKLIVHEKDIKRLQGRGR